MSTLYVAREKTRKALYMPMGQVSQNPSLLFPLLSVERSELDELIRIELEKVGITKESEVQAVLDKAEEDYEFRVKVDEATKEVRRLMEIRNKGGKLMSVGDGKWRQAFYPSRAK